MVPHSRHEERFGGYNADELWVRLENLKPEGRALYEQFQVFDGANAILMAIALTLVQAAAHPTDS